MTRERLSILATVSLVLLAASCTKQAARHSRSQPSAGIKQAAVLAREKVTVLALRDVMRYAHASLRYATSDVCIATREPKFPIRFDVPDQTIMESARHELPGAAAAP